MQKSLHLRSVCLHQWRVPPFALKCPCNPPPPPWETVSWRLSPPPPRQWKTVARNWGRLQWAGGAFPSAREGRVQFNRYGCWDAHPFNLDPVHHP